MFDVEELADLTTVELLDCAAVNRRSRLEAENELLLIAVAWADDQDRSDDLYSARTFRSQVNGDEHGADRRPQLDEDVVAEFGAVLGVGYVAARNLIADALAIRYRMPRIWQRVRDASIPAWQARKIAQASADLTWEQFVEVDAQLAGMIGLLPWPRMLRLVTAAVLDADPEAAEARELRARTERFVRSFPSEDGLKTLVARATSGDVTWFMAAVQRIADVLAAQGETDPIDVLRSRAVGILAHPAEALRVLASGVGAGEAYPEPAGQDAEIEEGAELVPPIRDPALIAEQSHVSLPAELPAGLDLGARSLRPRVTLYFHLTDAVLARPELGGLVRPEHGTALSLGQLQRFLADTGCAVTVRPVITPADQAPVDCYEIPSRIRESVRMRNLVDVFPFGSCDLRGMDLDHTVPYDPGGPPGQTGPANLGPLSRTSHRACTARIGPGGRLTGRWQKNQPDPGTFVWRSPHGWVYLTNNHGTFALGTSPFAARVWAQARSPVARAA